MDEEVDKENVFLNAIVKYKDENYYVVKINSKTAYISKDSEFLEKWEKASTKKWKDFCKINKAIMVDYSYLTIDELEIKKKDGFIEDMGRKRKAKRYLPNSEIYELQEIWSRLEKRKADADNKRKKKKYMKTYRYIVNYGRGKFYYALSYNFEEKYLLLRINNKYVFYDVKEDKYILFNKKLHKDGKNIIWPVRKEFIELAVRTA